MNKAIRTGNCGLNALNAPKLGSGTENPVKSLTDGSKDTPQENDVGSVLNLAWSTSIEFVLSALLNKKSRREENVTGSSEIWAILASTRLETLPSAVYAFTPI